MNRMTRSGFTLCLLALATFALGGAIHAQTAQTDEELAPDPLYMPRELFPVEPGINAQRGTAVAVDGDWLAMGAHLDDENGEDAGAVYLFHWSGTTWDQEAKLIADPPRPGAQLGSSLAFHDGVLAAGAPGEGAVYVFQKIDAWVQTARLTGLHHGAGAFGRAVALDASRLAVGAVDAHGAAAGAVYLFTRPAWIREPSIQPPAVPSRPGERFGSAISLAGSLLVVGAPGYKAGTGAVYVYERLSAPWKKTERLLSPNPGAGQQFGASVATDGDEIAIGAPTSGIAGTNSGAVYRFMRQGKTWSVGDVLPGSGSHAQLGTSVALSPKLLVAGAPAPPPGRGTGSVWAFRRSDGSRVELVGLNAEARDLAGLAVAVSGDRVAAGSVLGDQGSGAAGAAWSFHCPDDMACSEEAEAVARDTLSGRRFGASVALTDQLLAVGSPEDDEILKGTVYLYRNAGYGWRQEARLTSPYPGDGYGSSIALAGDLLVIGAPRPRLSPVSPPIDSPNGGVDLFLYRGSSWVFEASLAPAEEPSLEAALGASVAAADGLVAIGAPGDRKVYLFRKGDQRWAAVRVFSSNVAGFGSAVSLQSQGQNHVLAIGAPNDGDGAGALYISSDDGTGWNEPQPLTVPRDLDDATSTRGLGASVSVGSHGAIAVGAPGFFNGNGAVFLFEREGSSWKRPIRFSSQAERRFGSSVVLLGNRLLVGAPGSDTIDPNDLDHAVLFERQDDGSWADKDFDAIQPPHGDRFGAAVALSKDFFVITSPEEPRGDRVTVFTLQQGGNTP